MKKIITIMMVLAMVVALAVPALAAEGITADEQKLLDHFCAIVDEWAEGHPQYAAQQAEYKAMAEAALALLDAAMRKYEYIKL